MTQRPDIFVRSATASDLDALIALNGVVQRLHVRLEPEIFEAEVDAAELRTLFAALIGKADTVILMAEIAAEPVGYLWYDLQDRPPTVLTRACRRLYIHHVAVRETARRSGVATALLRAVEADAAARSVDRLVLDTWTRNADALRFFQEYGFEPFNVVLGKRPG